MAAPVFSTRFLAVHDQPALIKAEYVVPSSFLAVLRCIDVFYGGSLSAQTVLAYGSAGQVLWQETWAINLGGWRGWRGREVYYAGETIAIGGTDVMDFTASGYLLTAS